MRVPDPLRNAVLHARRRLALRRLSRVPTPPDAAAARILAAVGRALRGEMTVDEREWIRRIEDLRRWLMRSREPVALADFGAVESAAVTTTTVGERCLSSKSPLGALVLFHLMRQFQPRRCLELGTNLGISAAYQAAALRLNGGGVLDTVEGAPAIAALARTHLASLQLSEATVHEGRFVDVLPGLLARAATLDYVFIDGHHDGPATMRYFAQIHPCLSPGALVVFDDVEWSPGMAEAWAAIRADTRVRVAVSLGRMGVCIVGGDGDAIRLGLPIPG